MAIIQPRAVLHQFEIKTLHWIVKYLDLANGVKLSKWSKSALNYDMTIKKCSLGFMFDTIQRRCNESLFECLLLISIST